MTDSPEVAAIRAKLDGRMTDADPWNGMEVEMLLDALDERDKEIARLRDYIEEDLITTSDKAGAYCKLCHVQDEYSSDLVHREDCPLYKEPTS